MNLEYGFEKRDARRLLPGRWHNLIQQEKKVPKKSFKYIKTEGYIKLENEDSRCTREMTGGNYHDPRAC